MSSRIVTVPANKSSVSIKLEHISDDNGGESDATSGPDSSDDDDDNNNNDDNDDGDEEDEDAAPKNASTAAGRATSTSQPRTGTTKTRHTRLGGFEISRPLPPFVMREYTMTQILQMLKSEKIDLNPSYQRDVVWTAKRQGGLVNSIFQDYCIPPIIFNNQTRTIDETRSREVKVCIDGKQRLSSVSRFMNAEIPCFDRKDAKWYWPQDDYVQSRRNLLTEEATSAFERKTFLCYEYKGMTLDQEHDLFERVQRGNPLTAGEKAQATQGPWQALAWSFLGEFPEVLSSKSLTHRSIEAKFKSLTCRQHAETPGVTATTTF